MKHSDFKIGLTFVCGNSRWRCTDIGTRTIVALELVPKGDPSWFDGPPYAVSEIVLDEYDFPACSTVDSK